MLKPIGMIKPIETNNKPKKEYLFEHKYTLERVIVISSKQGLAFNMAMSYLKKFGEDNEISLINTIYL